MASPEQRLRDLGLTLPAPVSLPPDLKLPFDFINVRENRCIFSGHPRQGLDGIFNGPYGQVGKDLSTDEAYLAAKGVALSVLSNLKEKIQELSRVAGWVKVLGLVNSTPGFTEQHIVLNGFSDLILDIFGPEIGRHSRSAIGVAGLPMNFAMEVEGEILLQ